VIKVLHSISAWVLGVMFVGSVVMFVRSWWFSDQLERVVVESRSSEAEHVVHAKHVRLSSSRGRVTLAIVKSKTPHPAVEAAAELPRGATIARWRWSNFPDDLPAARKASKKWEKRVVFEYGRVVVRMKADETRRIVRGGRQRSDYLVVQWPLVVVALGAMAWLPARREMQRRKRPWRLLHGYCVECGYDLKKSLGACPECGKGRWGLE
jgi:hypothetical protein